MTSKEYTDLLRSFITGKLSLDELENTIDERLFELRRYSTAISREEKFLSEIELIICEIKDGFRTVAELEEYSKALLSPDSNIAFWNNTDKLTPAAASSPQQGYKVRKAR